MLIVDDHRAFAQAMALVLSMQPDLSARAVISGVEADRAILEDPPDVVLIDISVPRGLPAVARLLKRLPGVRILVLSDQEDLLLRARALGEGVHGFLSKFEPIDGVLDAVRAARNGDAPERPNRGAPATQKRRRLPHATERQRSDRLSPREREILQLIVDGLGSPEIVVQLEISPATLRTHVQNILTKLGVHSTTQAVLMAVRQGKVSTRR